MLISSETSEVLEKVWRKEEKRIAAGCFFPRGGL